MADGRVVAATENDTVYVLAARSGHVLWSHHLANAVPSGDLPCGDISPKVGITGTPVIDMSRHEIFVDADTLIKGPAALGGVEASHRLFGLDLFTGKIELDELAMPNAGEDQLAQLQRPGLALDQGQVVIAYGQNTGDCPGLNGPAHGFVVSIPETGGQLHYFQMGRGQDRGAVWMGGSSPVVDPNGNLYVASADGYDLGAGQSYDDSDAVLELSPLMQLESIFIPRTGRRSAMTTWTSELETPCWWAVSCSRSARRTSPICCVRDISVARRARWHTFRCAAATPTAAVLSGLSGLRAVPERSDGRQGVGEAPVPEAALDRQRRRGGGPIIADGLIWTIGGNAVHGLNPANGDRLSPSRSVGMRTTSRHRRSATACCYFPVPTGSSPPWDPPGCHRSLPPSNDRIGAETVRWCGWMAPRYREECPPAPSPAPRPVGSGKQVRGRESP